MMPEPLLRRRGVRLLSLFLAIAVAAVAAPRRREFHLPPGPAAQVLKQFAAQAQSEIVFSPEIVGDVRTRPVDGVLPPKEALDRMLAGTGLLATQDSTGAFAVRRAPAPEPRLERRPAARDAAPELVTLSPFLVPADTVGRYTASEATSGTRVRLALMDSPQSVSVVTRDLIDDLGAMRVLDAAKYVAGVSESTIPNAQDRTNVRGFQTDGATIDGFHTFSYANVDPVIVDRIEVVKGPNAILSPQIVQGTINLVSKKPLFADRGSAVAELGRFNANRAELDVNEVVSPGRMAVRVVGAAQRSHDQAPGNFRHSQVLMPMATWRIGTTAVLTLQAQFYNSYNAAYGGLPLDPAVGTEMEARLLRGVPRDLDLYTTMAARHDAGQQYRLFLTAEPTEHLSLRVAANAVHWRGSSVGITLGNPLDPVSGAQGLLVALDPATGVWRPTGVRNDAPVFPRAGTVAFQSRAAYNLQNDLAYAWAAGSVQATTLAGWMFDYAANPLRAVNFALPPLDPRHVAAPPYTFTGLNGQGTTYTVDGQAYVNEVVSLLDHRLILSGGVADAWYKDYVRDDLLHRSAANTPTAVLPNAGIVVRPRPELAIFAGVSREASAIAPSPSSPIGAHLQTGRQYEFGVRLEPQRGRTYASLAYFNISQGNFAVPNPANSVVPPPTPSYPPLLTDLRIHGIELEVRAALTNGLALVGSASALQARNPVGQPFRGIAERTAALWINYAFDHASAWHGWSVGLGVDYLGRRAGDVPSAVPTSASTPAHLVMPQPSFWLPPRTLWNAAVAYRWRAHWKAQLNVDNLANASYLAASTGRNTVFPGTPINPRLTVTYNW